jgi:hypothetical protein
MEGGPMMSQRAQPSDLELAALISSKICHDIINPVGAIYNGLEILDEEDDEEAKNYALDVIRNVTEQASAVWPSRSCASRARSTFPAGFMGAR